MKNKKENMVLKKIKLSTAIYSLLILIIFSFGVMSILAYGTNTQLGKRIASSLSRFIPTPAVVIDYKNIIALGSVEKNLLSVKQFYEKQDFSSDGIRIDFSTDNGQKRLKLKEKEVLNKMIEDEVVEMLAEKRGIIITKSEIDNNVDRRLNEFGTKDDVQKDLMRLYGWSLDDFKNKVVRPSMYREELMKAVENEISSDEARIKIDSAKKELDNGVEFEQVAKKYSDGESAKDGGEIGWTTKQQLIPDLQVALFENNRAEKDHSIIESELGFHIVEVQEQKKDNDERVIKIRQIFVHKQTFADWLDNEMKKMKFFVPLSDFYWDSKHSILDFNDEEMKRFEKDALANPQGDASVIF